MTDENTANHDDRSDIKGQCRMLCDLLRAYGMQEAVLSPGSRNAPLIIALERSGFFKTYVVVDERAAAFAALGLSKASVRPVGLVCTSGSALLNYAPACAEAYYSGVPLIVMSADRPEAWIGQNDSQTIRQPGALDAVVCGSIDISENMWASSDGPRWTNRRLNDLLSIATGNQSGPVHINFRFTEPLCRNISEDTRDIRGKKIEVVNAETFELPSEIRGQWLSAERVLIVVGSGDPGDNVRRNLEDLSANGCVVLAEPASNAGLSAYIRPDACLHIAGNRGEFIPDLLIYTGGAPVSRRLKEWLRQNQHKFICWRIGAEQDAIDTFGGLSARFNMPAKVFFKTLCSELRERNNEYARIWTALKAEAENFCLESRRTAEWSDFKAMSMLLEKMPSETHLQLGNGTAIRLAQFCLTEGRAASVHCNRGVSGIDGCTSTAMGFAADGRPTLFISGDMSAAYDIGALALGIAGGNFRMAVLNNGGGGIFRAISSTSSLPELERNFAAPPRLPLNQQAPAYGFRYLEAADTEELRQILPDFYAESDIPTILNIITPADTSAHIFKTLHR